MRLIPAPAETMRSYMWPIPVAIGAFALACAYAAYLLIGGLRQQEPDKAPSDSDGASSEEGEGLRLVHR
jgi:hypothetical protein